MMVTASSFYNTRFAYPLAQSFPARCDFETGFMAVVPINNNETLTLTSPVAFGATAPFVVTEDLADVTFTGCSSGHKCVVKATDFIAARVTIGKVIPPPPVVVPVCTYTCNSFGSGACVAPTANANATVATACAAGAVGTILTACEGNLTSGVIVCILPNSHVAGNLPGLLTPAEWGAIMAIFAADDAMGGLKFGQFIQALRQGGYVIYVEDGCPAACQEAELSGGRVYCGVCSAAATRRVLPQTKPVVICNANQQTECMQEAACKGFIKQGVCTQGVQPLTCPVCIVPVSSGSKKGLLGLLGLLALIPLFVCLLCLCLLCVCRRRKTGGDAYVGTFAAPTVSGPAACEPVVTTWGGGSMCPVGTGMVPVV